MGLRTISGDEHYGHIGFGSVTESAASAWSVGRLPAIAEPDLIIKTGEGRRKLEIDIEDVIVWDNRFWDFWTDNGPDVTGGENTLQGVEAIITKDNTVEGSAAPTADSRPQGTQPGGIGATTVGNATGTSPVMAGDEQPTRYVARVDIWHTANEEQSAVGHILHQFQQSARYDYPQYEVDGVRAHYLMTAAHYHLGVESQNAAAAIVVSLGANVRRMSIDLKELMFDRAVLLSILDALVVSS